MHIFVAVVISLIVGFGLGVWYCKPVRDELKALRSKAVDSVKGVAGKL